MNKTASLVPLEDVRSYLENETTLQTGLQQAIYSQEVCLKIDPLHLRCLDRFFEERILRWVEG